MLNALGYLIFGLIEGFFFNDEVCNNKNKILYELAPQ